MSQEQEEPMKITMTDGTTVELSNTKDIEERMAIVNGILNSYGECELEMLWNQPSTKYMLEGLANYLVWCKDEEELYKQDKEVMSKRKMKMLNKFDDKNIQFSVLSKTDQRTIGIGEVEENYE